MSTRCAPAGCWQKWGSIIDESRRSLVVSPVTYWAWKVSIMQDPLYRITAPSLDCEHYIWSSPSLLFWSTLHPTDLISPSTRRSAFTINYTSVSVPGCSKMACLRILRDDCFPSAAAFLSHYSIHFLVSRLILLAVIRSMGMLPSRNVKDGSLQSWSSLASSRN